MNLKLVQQRLNRLGYGPLIVDGTNGPKTEGALLKFEKDRGLPADGQQDPAVLDLLFPPVVIQSHDLRLRAIEYALSKEGVMEATGKNDGPEVETFLAAVGLGKGFPWCMAFVYWSYLSSSKDLKVPLNLVKTGGVLDAWRRFGGKKLLTTTDFIPQPGDIGIIDHGGGNGHTYLVVGASRTTVYTIEGNTNTDHSRNGNGVYQLERKVKDAIGFMRVS